MACFGGSTSPMRTGANVCDAMLGFAGDMSRHRSLDPIVRPPSSSLTSRPSLTCSSAVSQCWPACECL